MRKREDAIALKGKKGCALLSGKKGEEGRNTNTFVSEKK